MYIREQVPGSAFSQGYAAYTGDYSQRQLMSAPGGDRQRHGTASPYHLSVEAFWTQRLDSLLEREGPPVILVDAGAAAATSVMRLARRYRHEVRAGRVALVATNLYTSVPECIAQLKHGRRVEAEALYEETRGDFHQLTTGFLPDDEYYISMPQGEMLSLRGAADIVHERMAVTVWGRRLDVQIPALGRLVSRRGLYMVPLQDISLRRRLVEQRRVPPSLITAYVQLREQLGLSRSFACEEGMYAGRSTRCVFFKGAGAAPIAIAAAALSPSSETSV
jgi:hypothetical protein